MPATVPALPGAFVTGCSDLNDSTLPSIPTTGTTITCTTAAQFTTALARVGTGGDLDQNLNHVIALQAGNSFQGQFQSPPRTGTGWVTIRTTGIASLPSGRVSPADAPSMAKIVGVSNGGGLWCYEDSPGWYVVGLEFVADPAFFGYTYALCELGGCRVYGSGHQTPWRGLNMRLILERCYIHHGHAENFTQMVRGVQIDGRDVRVHKCYITDIQHTGQDAQALQTSDSEGIHLIEDNYLAATGMSIMYGGGGTTGDQFPGTNLYGDTYLPKDLILRRNTMEKLARWNSADPAWDGVGWNVKPTLEFKAALRVLVEGNVFNNSFGWPAVTIDAWNQGAANDSQDPSNYATTQARDESITVRHNMVTGAQSFVQLYTGNRPILLIRVENNLALALDHHIGGVGRFQVNSSGTALMMAIDNVPDVAFIHNTMLTCTRRGIMINAGGVAPRFQFWDNLCGYGLAGLQIEGATGPGWGAHGDLGGNAAVVAQYFPSADIARNGWINATAWPNYAAQDDSIQVAGDVQANWNASRWICPDTYGTSDLSLATGVLGPSSPFKSGGAYAAADGTDLGVNFTTLAAALALAPMFAFDVGDTL